MILFLPPIYLMLALQAAARTAFRAFAVIA